MPSVQIPDEKNYIKAIGLLHQLGGMFRTQPTRELIVSPSQLQALREAGLVQKVQGAGKHGKKSPTHS
jgi:hypothetical protein